MRSWPSLSRLWKWFILYFVGRGRHLSYYHANPCIDMASCTKTEG